MKRRMLILELAWKDAEDLNLKLVLDTNSQTPDKQTQIILQQMI